MPGQGRCLCKCKICHNRIYKGERTTNLPNWRWARKEYSFDLGGLNKVCNKCTLKRKKSSPAYTPQPTTPVPRRALGDITNTAGATQSPDPHRKLLFKTPPAKSTRASYSDASVDIASPGSTILVNWDHWVETIKCLPCGALDGEEEDPEEDPNMSWDGCRGKLVVDSKPQCEGEYVSVLAHCAACKTEFLIHNGLDRKVKIPSRYGASPRTTGHRVVNIRAVVGSLLGGQSYAAYQRSAMVQQKLHTITKNNFEAIGKLFWGATRDIAEEEMLERLRAAAKRGNLVLEVDMGWSHRGRRSRMRWFPILDHESKQIVGMLVCMKSRPGSRGGRTGISSS